jgi:hypothetical protein
MWVRPAYRHEAWPAGDDRRLINLDHSRAVRVTRGAFPPRAGWAVEAIVETADPNANVSRTQGRTALLAAVPTERLATGRFDQVQRALAAGTQLLDLRPGPHEGAEGTDDAGTRPRRHRPPGRASRSAARATRRAWRATRAKW